MLLLSTISSFFFFNDTATTEIYTLSLHDALPIYLDLERLRGSAALAVAGGYGNRGGPRCCRCGEAENRIGGDRKSTRLNSSHQIISYALFFLKKKKKTTTTLKTCRSQ